MSPACSGGTSTFAPSPKSPCTTITTPKPRRSPRNSAPAPCRRQGAAWAITRCRRSASLRRTGKMQQVAVRIADDEVLGAPRLRLERLMKRDARRRVLREQAVDVVHAVDGHRRREQALALPARVVEHGSVDAAQIEPRSVAHHLAVELFFYGEDDHREAELLREEAARR